MTNLALARSVYYDRKIVTEVYFTIVIYDSKIFIVQAKATVYTTVNYDRTTFVLQATGDVILLLLSMGETCCPQQRHD
jgi:hypothetical protein